MKALRGAMVMLDPQTPFRIATCSCPRTICLARERAARAALSDERRRAEPGGANAVKCDFRNRLSNRRASANIDTRR